MRLDIVISDIWAEDLVIQFNEMQMYTSDQYKADGVKLNGTWPDHIQCSSLYFMSADTYSDCCLCLIKI